MYDRFSRESMEIIAFSQEEAEEWRHSYVGTEHLLLAFLKTKESNVFRFLTTHGVTYEKVSTVLESEKGRGKVRLSADDLEPTPRLKRVMKISFEEARRAGLNSIRPEHLLMGMLREGEGTGAAILLHLGINLSKTRAYFLPSAGVGMALRSTRRLVQRFIGDFHPVVALVVRPEALHDLHGLFHRRFLDEDRLKAALQRRILLHRLAIFIECGRADALDRSGGKWRFEDRRSVDRSLGTAGTDDCLQLIDEQDNIV